MPLSFPARSGFKLSPWKKASQERWKILEHKNDRSDVGGGHGARSCRTAEDTGSWTLVRVVPDGGLESPNRSLSYKPRGRRRESLFSTCIAPEQSRFLFHLCVFIMQRSFFFSFP